MNGKDRKAALEVLSKAFLDSCNAWERVKGHDRSGPFHVLRCGEECWLRLSIGIHPDLDQVSVRVGWQADQAQPATPQDPRVMGEGTLEQVRGSSAPKEFRLESFSTPLGALIARGFVKVYEVPSLPLASFAGTEMLNDIKLYAFPYFDLFLRSKGLPSLAVLTGHPKQ